MSKFFMIKYWQKMPWNVICNINAKLVWIVEWNRMYAKNAISHLINLWMENVYVMQLLIVKNVQMLKLVSDAPDWKWSIKQ